MLNEIINVDLHIHSEASAYKEGKIKKRDGSEIGIVDDSTVKNIDIILNKLDSNFINLFSFTDHNRFDSNLYKIAQRKIKEKNREHLKNIVAGVEFDVKFEQAKKSCHIITIFDTKNDGDLDKISKEIEADKLLDKSDVYTLSRFEMLMKKINLNTIFIACQRKALDNPNGGTNSISNSINDIYEFLKVGFISALEYQKSNVEGMLKENLKDFPKEIGLVCGSDCHQWSVYPKHDELENNPNKKWYFSIKALPTFLGLLLSLSSPKTRFSRANNYNNYIHYFTYENQQIPLSSGINAIIGENGSGKSTLLSLLSNEKLLKYQKELLKNSKIEFNQDNSNEVKSVMQNEIIKRNNNTNNNLFKDEKFNDIDNSKFEDLIKNYSSQLFKYIKTNINYYKKSNLMNDIKIQLDPVKYYKNTYYIRVNLENFSVQSDIYKNHIDSLKSLLDGIKKEYEASIYNEEAKTNLKTAYSLILKIHNDFVIEYKKYLLESETINIIIEKAKSYNNNIINLSVEEDKSAEQYRNGIYNFKKDIISFYKKYIFSTHEIPKWNSLKNIGSSNKKENGYIFIKKAKYFQKEGLNEELLNSIFNKSSQSIEEIKKIKTENEFISAITGANKDNYERKYNENVEKFISQNEQNDYEVMEAASNNKMGNTLGEKSLVFYKYITFEEAKYNILFIDQPEDNISNAKIYSNLILYLNNLRDNKQIIFVTHNPLLVINLDVDNVIFLSNKNNKIDLDSGCIEQEGNLTKISTLLDGGKETIEKRLKLYYGD